MALEESRNASTVGLLSFADQLDVRDMGLVLWRRIGIVAWSVVCVLALGALMIFSLVPRYTASAFVEVNPRQANIVNFEAVLSGLPADSATIETEIEVLRSRKLAEKAVEKLNLFSVPEFNWALKAPSVAELGATALLANLGFGEQTAAPALDSDPDTTAWYSAASEFRAQLRSWLSRDEDGLPRSLASIAERERSSVIDVFLDRLDVEPQGRSRVIGISFESENPRIAAAAVNTVADLYIVSQLEAKYEAAKRANAWLNERVSVLREEVKAAERAVEEFRSRSGLIQGRTSATLTGEQVSELNAQYITERTRLAEALARLRQVENLLQSPDGIETAGEVLNSQTIRDLRRQETEVERRLAELSNEYGDRHPRMINARAELVDVREKIRVEINKIIQSMRNEVAVAKARARALQNALQGLKNDVAGLNAAEVQLRHLEREAAASRQLLEQLLTRSKQTASQTDFQQPDATIITTAPIPKEPTYPKTLLLLIVSAVLGMGIGISGAFLVDRFDHGYRSAEEITKQLGLTGLGLIPSISKLKTLGKSPSEYCIENPTSAYAEALRGFYTNLLLSDVGHRPTVVLIASALPSEGKTSLVVSLARQLSLAGQNVVAVDCDLKRPALHKAFGVKDGAGLIECINGNEDLNEIIQRDKLSSVDFIRAGAIAPDSVNVLDSVRFQRLLKTLSRNYDLVLLDSAPVLAVSDTLFLGRLANKTVFVVRWASTRREKVELALRKLKDAHADVAGVLLSMVDVKAHAQYRYSDSGAYHGSLKRYYTG